MKVEALEKKSGLKQASNVMKNEFLSDTPEEDRIFLTNKILITPSTIVDMRKAVKENSKTQNKELQKHLRESGRAAIIE